MKYLEHVMVGVVAALAPIKATMLTVGILIVIDLITGIMAARKRGEKITSAALRRTVTKCLVYQTAVVTGFLVEKYLAYDLVPVSKIIGGLIGSVELKSCLENLNTINGNNIFKDLLEKLGSKNDVVKQAQSELSKPSNKPESSTESSK